ncbi:hypothetical protein WJX72_007323 [[Myrmecia] bisecta]|uniref:Ubiquitin carboxyl-terminal hydrolase n=1 Tax=[Myrmecia] bisecta TaxID=41462 RepID=A0AAW1PKY2_9CHLO
MGSVRISVKWQKETFNDVEVELSQPGLMLKNQLFSLTGVAPERQKIMVKGGMLKDDADMTKLGLKPGQKLMMMGTADKVPEAPTNAPVFVEDLPEEQQDLTGYSKYGAGLQNLGNTCYMNSTVQCLYRVPELRTALQQYPETTGTQYDTGHKLTVAAKGLFADMDRSAQPVPPFRFLLMMREKYPQFAQQNREGHYMQQDAEECFSQLMYTLRESLKDPSKGETSAIVQHLFGVGLHSKLTAAGTTETIEEDATAYSLKCNISIDVNNLSEGIKLGLKDDREKNSEQLGRTTVFEGSSVITRLPAYLTVQMVRFFFKADVQQKAKILRKVTFPLVLDLLEFASEDLKAQLKGPREAAQEVEDKKAGLAKDANNKRKAEAAAGETSKADAEGDTEMKDAGEAASSSSAAEDSVAKYKGQLTGRYDLVAVLTHKGRSADSGHYVSWVKQDDGQWIQFDDDEMIPRKEDEIITLAGGGDWHMAYLLLYRAQRV